jgi:hypothetical protein
MDQILSNDEAQKPLEQLPTPDVQPEQVSPAATAETAEETDFSAVVSDEEADLEQTLPEEEEEDFSTFDMEKMNQWLQQALQAEPDGKLRKQFSSIRTHFHEVQEELKQQSLATFKEDGGQEEEFEFQPSSEAKAIRDLIRKLSDKLRDERRQLEKQMEANLLARQDLISELRNLMENESNMGKAFEKLRGLQERWKSVGQIPKAQADDIYKTWRHHVDAFYSLASINKDLFQMELSKNLEQKKNLIRQAQELLAMDSIKRSLEMLHVIQREWREVGPVPKDQDKEIFESFKAACDALYLRREEHSKAQDDMRKANLQAKEALAAQLEALSAGEYPSMKHWKEGEVSLQQIEEQWKKIGPVPKSVNDAIWSRFREARKAFHKKRLALLKESTAKFQENYTKKIALCEKAEALSQSNDWKETANQLVRLQQDWKKIGPVERKRSDEIWNRFRTACDTFFQAREAWFAGREDRDKASVDARKAIIADLEKVEAAESLEETMERIKPIQDAWNQAPQVGGNDRKALDKAWNDALNKVFSALNIDPVKRQRLEYKARIDAMMASPHALGLLRDERSFLGNRVRKLEEELLQTENNLAFFGKSKGAEALRQQYEGKMEQTRKEIEGLKDRQHQIKHALKQLESNS